MKSTRRDPDRGGKHRNIRSRMSPGGLGQGVFTARDTFRGVLQRIDTIVAKVIDLSSKRLLFPFYPPLVLSD